MNTATRDILVVDDDPATVDLVIEVLTDAGYATRRANNGAEAVLSIRAQRPSLLLTDLWMPGMSGIDLLHQVRADHPSLPIVVMTAAPQAALTLAQQHGVTVVAKPFDLDELIAHIRCLLDRQSDISGRAAA